MARDHARIDVSIWDDEDFLALSDQAQRLYFLLLSQRELSYAGLLPMRLRRWASRSKTTTVETVTAALAELDASRFVVCDHDAEEVLIRSLIRNDGIYKQPNVLAGALREAFLITSPVLRSALAAELRRLPVTVVGTGPEMTAAALVAGVGELPAAIKAATGTGPGKSSKKKTARPRPQDTPPPGQQDEPHRQTTPDPEHDPADHPSGNPSANPSGNPSAKGSARGLGEGGRGQGAFVAPLTLETGSVGGVPRTRVDAPTREEAARLVEQEVGGQPRRTATRLAGEVAKLLTEGIDPVHITAGLRLWAGKRLGPGLLPDLVSEAIRAPRITAAGAARSRSTTDERVAAALALAEQYATEEARNAWDSTDAGDAGPRVVAGLLAGAA